MSFYQGKLFRIKIGTKTIFHEVDFQLSSSLDFSEIASKDLQTKEFSPQDIDWTISCSSLIGNSDGSTQEDAATLYASHVGKTLIDIEFTTDAAGDMIFSGQAYVSQYDLDSANDDVAKGSFSFRGTGDLALGVVA